MQTAGDWVRYSATNWIVWTDKNAEQIFSILKPHVGNDQFLIVEVNMSEHFQWLTEDVGDPRLREHLASVIVLMKAAGDWENFKRMIDRALPRYNDNYELALGD